MSREDVFGKNADHDQALIPANQGNAAVTAGLLDDDMDIKINPMPLSPTIHRRSYMQRTFSPLGKGSVRGSIFALCASAVGSGVLTLPYVLALCGWAAGITFMIIAALAARTTLSMLANCACELSLPNYSKIVERAGG